jgi:hypothetical protein
MAAFDRALARVQQEPLLPSSDRIDQLARQQQHTFRNTLLTPGVTLNLFVRQIAAGNLACAAMRHVAGSDFSDSAWCQARTRLPMTLLQQVHQQVIQQARHELDRSNDLGDGSHRWRGHRVYVIDGSSDSMPDTPPLRQHYGVPAVCGKGLGFPTSHLLLLMDHCSGLLIECVDGPMVQSDVSQTPAMHTQLSDGDIVLGDAALSGWTHLALILQANLHAVLPVHHQRIVDFTPGRTHAHPHKGKAAKRIGKPRSRVLKTLGNDDQLVEYFKPAEKPAWISQVRWDSLPPSITVREVRRTIKRAGFRPITVTIVTTLLDPQTYPADELIELRLSRWMVETNLRHLKVTLKMGQLKCKTLDGVRKERLVFLLVYNLIRILMMGSARNQRVKVNRISFADTLAWMRHGQCSAAPKLLINPLRPGRLEPRVCKKPRTQYCYMTIARAELKSQLRARYHDTT